MSLINCEECDAEISDKAQHCIKCGAPIVIARESQAAGAELATIQETSKKLKSHIIVTAILFWVGLILWVGNIDVVGNRNIVTIGQLMTYTGAFFYIVTRFRVWWHHG